MKIDKVVLTIESIDDEHASVHISTTPPVTETDFDDLEDSPAYELGQQVWAYVQSLFEIHEMDFTDGKKLQ